MFRSLAEIPAYPVSQAFSQDFISGCSKCAIGPAQMNTKDAWTPIQLKACCFPLELFLVKIFVVYLGKSSNTVQTHDQETKALETLSQNLLMYSHW